MLAERYPSYLAGSPEQSSDVLAITDKHTDVVVTRSRSEASSSGGKSATRNANHKKEKRGMLPSP